MEDKERDYKDEYKKFQSSDKSKKYRSELNKYNRKKGTYGNGDGKDASHKGGKIAGFEAESKNRGRAEKSRLKKEQKLTEKPLKTNPKIWVPDKFDKVIDKLPYSKLTKKNIIKLAKKFKVDENDALRWVSYNQDVDFGLKEQKLREVIRKIIREDFAGAYPESKRKSFDGKRRKQSEVLGYKLTGVDDVKTEIDDATIKEAAGGLTYKKGKTITVTHKRSGKELVIIDKPNVRKEYEKIGYVAEGKLIERVIKVKKKPFPDVKNGMKQLKGEDKIAWLVWMGAKKEGKSAYEIKGKKLNVIGLNPRDRGFYVNHFGNRTGIRRDNLYYDGKQWKTGEKF